MLHHVPCITARDYMCIFLTSHFETPKGVSA